MTSALASVGARAITTLISLVTVPISLSYLGAERYGLWATVIAFVAMLSFADLGVGNSIVNSIATSSGRGDRRAIAKTMTNGLVVLCSSGVIILIVFLIIFPFVPWDRALGVRDQAIAREAAIAMLVLMLLLAFEVPTGIVQRLQYGLQRGYLNSIVQIVGSVLTLVLIFTVVRFDLGLVGMVSVFLLAPMLATWASGALMLSRAPDIRPSRMLLDSKEMQLLLRTGGQFFIIQVSWSVCFASDNLVIAHMVGPEAVTTYSIHQKLFSPVMIFVGFLMTPLWPAYADAIARNEIAWVKAVLWKSALLLGFGGLIGTTLIFCFLDPLLTFWLDGKLTVDYGISIAICIWIVVDSAGKAFGIFMNGAGILREQVYIAAVFVPVCLVLKVLFAKWYGPAGVPIAMAIAWTVIHVPPYWMIVRRWFREHPSNSLNA